jgi:hypothetical protein
MKKIIYLILLSSICISLAACGKKDNEDKNSEQQSNVSQKNEQETESVSSDNFDKILESEIAQPYDVPKVLVYYSDDTSINADTYSDCQIIIVDKQDGTYEPICDSASTIKLRGNSTIAAYKKAFNFKFSSKTDVLGMGKNKKWTLLANSFDKTLLRNQTVFDISKQLKVPFTPDYRVVDVYLNDTLQGSYLLVDTIEVGSNRVDIDTTDNEFLLELDYNPQDEESRYFYSPTYEIKFAINEPELKDLTSEQYKYIKELITNAEIALTSGDMSEIEKYFDIDSMASFYLVQEFFRNVDVNTSSTRFHVKDGKIYGGPVWDFDLSAGNYLKSYYKSMYDENGDCYAGLKAVKMPWFGALCEVTEFQNLVNQKFLDMQDTLVNLYEDNSLGQNYIDKTIETYNGSISRNYGEAGWKVYRIYTFGMVLERQPERTYEENVEFYRNWLKNRNEWLLEKWGL